MNLVVSQFMDGTARNGSFEREAATQESLKEDGSTHKSPLCWFKWNSRFDTILSRGAQEGASAHDRKAEKGCRTVFW
jgi:hypothetical protein